MLYDQKSYCLGVDALLRSWHGCLGLREGFWSCPVAGGLYTLLGEARSLRSLRSLEQNHPFMSVVTNRVADPRVR